MDAQIKDSARRSEVIRKVYYDPSTGYQSFSKIYRKIKAIESASATKYPSITQKEVKEFIDKQTTAQLNRAIRRPKVWTSIRAPRIRANYQMDIIVYDRYSNAGYKYILCLVDVYSRYAEARAMTNRRMETIIENTESIFDEMGYPENLNLDNEFNKKDFNELMIKNDVAVHFSDPNAINKNSIVERFNRTLANLLQRWRIANKTYDWQRVLPDIIENYNNSYHRTIGTEPAKIWKGKDTNHQVYTNRVVKPFKAGELVRIQKDRTIFTKGDITTYSDKIYTVVAQKGQRVELDDGSIKNDTQLLPANSIVTLDPEAQEREIAEAIEKKEEKVVKKVRSQEKIEPSKESIKRDLRPRKPANQLEDQKYGRLLY
jgi:hypothetical protein